MQKRFFLTIAFLFLLSTFLFGNYYNSMDFKENSVFEYHNKSFSNQNLKPSNFQISKKFEIENFDKKVLFLFPIFLIVFFISFIGGYTIYLAGLGLIAFGIVFFITKGDKKKSRRALWGFLSGTILGILTKLLVMRNNV